MPTHGTGAVDNHLFDFDVAYVDNWHHVTVIGCTMVSVSWQKYWHCLKQKEGVNLVITCHLWSNKQKSCTQIFAVKCIGSVLLFELQLKIFFSERRIKKIYKNTHTYLKIYRKMLGKLLKVMKQLLQTSYKLSCAYYNY